MSKSIKADHSQIFLLPPALEDWVPADHSARFIREFVKNLDFKALGFTETSTNSVGRDGYSPELLLSVWLYGCFHRIYSNRKLEFACKNEMGLIWLTGLNYPDHNTIWRFWREHKDLIKQLFKQTVLVADSMGMVGMVLHAIDGTKIQTASSRRTHWTKSRLDKKLKMLDESIEEIEKEIEAAGEASPSMNLPEELQNAKALRESIQKAKAQLEEEGITNCHPHEPDARVMKNQRVFEPCYNAQIAVDSKNQIIVAEALVNEENDSAQLNPMLDLVKENLGKVADENLADSGYQTEKAIEEAESAGYNILVNDSQQRAIDNNELHPAHFEYDSINNTVICPKGTELKFERSKKGKPSQGEIQIFRCKNKDCPLIRKCTKDPRGRAVEISKYRAAVQRQRQKRESEIGKKLLAQRAGIVEPVFGAIKSAREFKRFSCRSLEKASIQWSWMCTIHNLKKIYQKWLNQIKANAALMGVSRAGFSLQSAQLIFASWNEQEFQKIRTNHKSGFHR